MNIFGYIYLCAYHILYLHILIFQDKLIGLNWRELIFPFSFTFFYQQVLLGLPLLLSVSPTLLKPRPLLLTGAVGIFSFPFLGQTLHTSVRMVLKWKSSTVLCLLKPSMSSQCSWDKTQTNNKTKIISRSCLI